MAFELVTVAIALSAITLLACLLAFAPKRLVVLRKSLLDLKPSQINAKPSMLKEGGPNKNRVWGSMDLKVPN
jgi:hypothetical protein